MCDLLISDWSAVFTLTAGRDKIHLSDYFRTILAIVLADHTTHPSALFLVRFFNLALLIVAMSFVMHNFRMFNPWCYFVVLGVGEILPFVMEKLFVCV